MKSIMRVCLVLSCILICYSGGLAQTKIVIRNNDDPSVRAVKTLLLQPSGFSSGFSEKQADRLGDRVSVALLKIFTKEELRDPQNVMRFLPIIRSSFLYPKLIPAAYRKPKVTLPFLTRLEEQVSDAKLKGDIAELMQFIREQTKKK
jgi:hypothetical protein